MASSIVCGSSQFELNVLIMSDKFDLYIFKVEVWGKWMCVWLLYRLRMARLQLPWAISRLCADFVVIFFFFRGCVLSFACSPFCLAFLVQLVFHKLSFKYPYALLALESGIGLALFLLLVVEAFGTRESERTRFLVIESFFGSLKDYILPILLLLILNTAYHFCWTYSLFTLSWWPIAAFSLADHALSAVLIFSFHWFHLPGGQAAEQFIFLLFLFLVGLGLLLLFHSSLSVAMAIGLPNAFVGRIAYILRGVIAKKLVIRRWANTAGHILFPVSELSALCSSFSHASDRSTDDLPYSRHLFSDPFFNYRGRVRLDFLFGSGLFTGIMAGLDQSMTYDLIVSMQYILLFPLAFLLFYYSELNSLLHFYSNKKVWILCIYLRLCFFSFSLLPLLHGRHWLLWANIILLLTLLMLKINGTIVGQQLIRVLFLLCSWRLNLLLFPSFCS